MLILTRKSSESIRIGDDITITIMRIEPGQVRVGIEAPRGLAVHREEVYARIQAKRPDAAPPGPAMGIEQWGHDADPAEEPEQAQIDPADEAEALVDDRRPAE